MIYRIEIQTHHRNELLDITEEVARVIKKSNIKNGTAIIFVPHTTAGITLNENYDPSVRRDISESLARLFPKSGPYSHTEGNADAHIKSAIVGSSRTVFFENGNILFGTWQGIFFCEFDGPRRREVFVKIIPDA
uniref:YjbQ family protein n=1 Tax=candidate division WOR-3 bacterium TaxID=2052148 RepID=A0A7C3YSC6_UNCW3